MAAVKLKEQLEDDDKKTYYLDEQRKILGEIEAQYTLYAKYAKYGFETEGATASAAGYMAAIVVSAVAALI